MFQNFKFDPPSFLVGLVAGLLVWFLFNLIKKVLPTLRQMVKVSIKRVLDVVTGGAARYVRFTARKKAQKAHLASTLFALDEVVVPPRFLAPIGAENLLTGAPGETYLPKIFPFLPAWPELASQYNWPSLSAEEILQNGANIAIIGQPGSGKSVALAYLASKFSRKDLALISLADCVPIYVHIHELGDLEKVRSLFESAVHFCTTDAPVYMKSQIPGYLSGQARAGNLVFLLDGLDQLDAASLSTAARLLATDLKTFPKLRVVVAASPDYLDGLLNIGFQPLSIASWNLNERIHFAAQWGQKWQECISPQIKKQIPDYEVGQLFIESWISFDAPYFTPLDWTLKLWSLYSGDAIGTSPLLSITAYIKRASKPLQALEPLAALALNCLHNGNGLIPQTQAEAVLSLTQNSKAIPQLSANGILNPIRDGALCFSHPTILAFLASLGFAEDPAGIDLEAHNPADDWLLHFLAVQNKAGAAVQRIIDESGPPFYTGLFAACRWLKDSPLTLDWRTFLMRQLMKLLMQPDLSVELRSSIISALVVANDPAVVTLLRQMLSSPDDSLRILTVLGCGALQDTKSLHEIAILLEDMNVDVRLAACLALGIISSPVSLSYITNAFTTGDESLKQVAAEGLTFIGEDGYSLLREEIGSESLIVRRAVVFALANVKQEWARQLLEQIAVQDGQWVVRNAAVQALEIFNKPNPYIPAKLPAPSQAPWLIAYAARQGVGVPPDGVPIELLYSALEDGTEEEKIASLDYMRLIPNEEIIQKVYRLAASEHGAMKDAAMLALWYLRASGVRLTVTMQ